MNELKEFHNLSTVVETFDKSSKMTGSNILDNYFYVQPDVSFFGGFQNGDQVTLDKIVLGGLTSTQWTNAMRSCDFLNKDSFSLSRTDITLYIEILYEYGDSGTVDVYPSVRGKPFIRPSMDLAAGQGVRRIYGFISYYNDGFKNDPPFVLNIRDINGSRGIVSVFMTEVGGEVL